MNGPDELPRLRHAAAPGTALAAGLAAARERGPSEAQLRAMEAALAATLGASAAGAGMGVVAGKATSGAGVVSVGALKLTAAFVALAAVAGGVTMWRSRPVEAPGAIEQVGPAPARPLESPPPAAAPQPPAAARPSPGVVQSERAAGAPHARRGADQLALITRAQRTLASDPAAALALVEDNRRVLAQSSFAQEAEVIAVAALARLGRTDEAGARAARFVARFPESVHAARMRRVAAIIK